MKVMVFEGKSDEIRDEEGVFGGRSALRRCLSAAWVARIALK